MPDIDPIVIEALPYSSEVLDSATNRLVKAGFRDALSEDRFERLTSRLVAAYTTQTLLKRYLGTFKRCGRKVHFEILDRSPFAARAAAEAHFGHDEFISVSHESGLSGSEIPAGSHLDVASIPYSEEMVALLHRRDCQIRRRGRESFGRRPTELSKSEVAEMLTELRDVYHEDAPLHDYIGWVMVDSEKTSLKTTTSTLASAVAAVIADFGEDHSIHLRRYSD